MLITNTKFKDYYDGIVNTLGIDKSIVYNRKTTIIDDVNEYPTEFKKKKFGKWNDINKLMVNIYYKSKTNKYREASHFIIGFCGKLYIGFKLYSDDKENVYGKKVNITYDVSEVKRYFDINNSFFDFNEYLEYIKLYDTINTFRELNTTIFLYDSGCSGHWYEKSKFIINPVLNEYDFYKVFDSFNAFQEIQMFIGGVLGTNKNSLIEISDKDKIISRGFDYKWSFRKESDEK